MKSVQLSLFEDSHVAGKRDGVDCYMCLNGSCQRGGPRCDSDAWYREELRRAAAMEGIRAARDPSEYLRMTSGSGK